MRIDRSNPYDTPVRVGAALIEYDLRPPAKQAERICGSHRTLSRSRPLAALTESTNGTPGKTRRRVPQLVCGATRGLAHPRPDTRAETTRKASRFPGGARSATGTP